MQIEKIASFNNIFSEIPIACAILNAQDLRIEQANDEVLEIWGRNKSAVGYKLLDVMPELADQTYPALIRQVLLTNTTHKEKAGKATLFRNGVQETIFVDFCYTPILGQNGKSTALLITATDVTDIEKNKLFRTEAIRTLKAVIMTSPVAMCYFVGENHAVNTVNEHMIDLWKKHEYLGVRELKYVFHTGLPYTHTVHDITYSYTPVRDGLGKTTGVTLVAGPTPGQPGVHHHPISQI